MSNPCRVVFTPTFANQLKALKRRYRSIEKDLQMPIEALEKGETIGDRIQGLEQHRVYKVRVANRDAQRGKSGGYRLLYYLYIDALVVVFTIYSKSDQTDISAEVLRRHIAEIKEILDSGSTLEAN